MRKVLTLLVLLPLFSFSQKIVKDKVDDFEGYRDITTSDISLKKKDAYCFFNGSLSVIKADTAIAIHLYVRTPFALSINEGDKIFLKLDDGSMLEAPNRYDYNIYASDEPAGVYFFVSKDMAEKLISHKVVKYRISTKDANIDGDVPDRSQDKFGAIIQLLEQQSRLPSTK